jgi:hypothetical protein
MPWRGAGADQRGAAMLIGLFMAVFLVALLYYVVGIADAIAHRERMQDAADAAAFSAAALLAHGMNTIALTNMVMAALLAILVALKLVETLAAIAIVLIAALAFLSPGLASFIPGLSELRADVRAAHDELEPPIHAALSTLHVLARGVRTLAPIAAELRAAEIVREHYRPPAQLGLLLRAPGTTLPTEDGAFAEVCDRATGYAGDLVALSLSAAFVPEEIAGLVGDATADLTSGGGTWFCGGTARAPETTLRPKRELPVLPSRAACNDYDVSDAAYDAREHEALCERAEADEQASSPDERTGACVQDCRDDGPYAQRAQLAREQCRPDKKRTLRQFTWVERRVERTYEFRRGAWRVQASRVVPLSTRRIVAAHAPCGTDARAVAPHWELETRGADGAHQPLCSGEEPPQKPAIEGATYGPLYFTEVVDLLGCVERAELTRKLDRDAAGEEAAGDDETPQRIAGGALLGEEPFQARVVVLGDPPSRAAEALVRLATWGDAQAPSAGDALLAGARSAARTAYAQAEFYYAVRNPDADERADYLWNTRWHARLRRFRRADAGTASPADDLGNMAADTCRRAGALGGTCNGLNALLDPSDERFIH